MPVVRWLVLIISTMLGLVPAVWADGYYQTRTSPVPLRYTGAAPLCAGTDVLFWADANGTKGSCLQGTTHYAATTCRSTVVTARLNELCVSGDSGEIALCQTPSTSGDAVLCDAAVEWLVLVGAGRSLPGSATVALSGASTTAAALIPAHSFVLGVKALVTEAITGATSFQVGVAEDLTRWGDLVAVDIDTETHIGNFSITAPSYYPTATDVVVTAQGGDFTDGTVVLYVYYTTLEAFAMQGVTHAVTQIADTAESIDGDATDVAVSGAAKLEFLSDDGSLQFEVLESVTGPPQQLIQVNARALLVSESDTLNSVFSRGNEITNPTSLTPFRVGPTTGMHREEFIAGGILVNAILDGAGNRTNQNFNVGDGLAWTYGGDAGDTYALKGTEREVEFAAGSQFTPPNGAGAPTGTDCDNADEAGREYTQTTPLIKWYCQGAAGWRQLQTLTKSLTVLSPTASLTNKVQWVWPYAITLTRVWCSTDVGTATIQLDERAEATPNTAGTNSLTAALVCDATSEATTSFSDAVIAARVPHNLQITAVASAPTVVRVHAEGTY